MSATYVLGSRRANSARRVADSKRIGRTPVASGSSVPACPTRCAPVRRRRRLTTANEVSPAALSTLRTPAGNRGRPAGPTSSVVRRGGKNRLLGGSKHHLHGLVHRPLDLRTGSPNVAATSERGAQRRRVHRSPTAHADLRQRVVDFLEEDGQLQAGNAVERIDDAFGLG